MYRGSYNYKNLIVWVDMSTYCNASCPECHRTNPNGLDKVDWLPLVQWSIADFKKLYPPKTMEHIYKFDFCGTFGDPLMTKDIDEIITYIAENSNCMIQIHTNGSRRTEEWWWKIGVMLGNRLDVVFAIEGTSKEQHSFYRQKTDLFEVMNNLETLAATKAYVNVFCVVHKHNQDSLYDIAKMCKEAGADNIWFCPSNRFYKSTGRTRFKFIKDGQVSFLEKAEIDYNDEMFNRGYKLNNDKALKIIEQMQHNLRMGFNQ